MKQIQMNKSLKILVCLLILAFSVEPIKSQNKLEIYQEIETLFGKVNADKVTTGYLFNKGFIFFEDELNYYKEEYDLISNLKKWKIFYNCIQQSNINSDMELKDVEVLLSSENETIPIGFLYFIGNYMDENDVSNLIDNSNELQTSEPYKTYKLFAATPFLHSINYGNVKFELNPSNFHTNINEKIISIEIDFADGNGFNSYDFRNQTINVSYTSTGHKSITFRLLTDNDTLLCYSKFNVKHLDIPITNKKETIYSSSGMLKSAIEGGEYEFYQGGDKIDKPVIIIEGFDILDEEDASELIQDYEDADFTTDLRDNGYDIYTLSYSDPSRPIAENAEVLKRLINIVNSEKEGNFESAILGESMGGLVARIALKEMEDDGLDHQVGLYISFDSPHKGAHIPYGMQTLLQDILDLSLDNLWLKIAGIKDEFDEAEDAFDKLNSTAAKQLLIWHYSRGSEFTDFHTFLDNLGYPEQTRNVALINGSDEIDYQDGSLPVTPTDRISFVHMIDGAGRCLIQVNLEAWFCPVTTSSTQVSRARKWNACFKTQDRSGDQNSNDKFWDNAPGSFYDLTNFSDDVDYNFCFVPTVSSVDINQSIIDGTDGLLAYDENTVGRRRQDIISNNHTPFDDIYSLWYNQEHISTRSWVMDEIEQDEFMYDDMYIQNKTISNDRDFEANNSISFGREVASNNLPDKIIEVGDVKITNGAKVNVYAGNSITLGPGFSVDKGCEFSATVGTTTTKSAGLKSATFTKLSPPVISYNYDRSSYSALLISAQDSLSTYNWKITGNNKSLEYIGKEFKLPELSQGLYTLFCTKTFEGRTSTISTVIKSDVIKSTSTDKIQEKTISVTENVNISAFPNPSKGNVTFSFQVLNTSNVNLSIIDINGAIVQNIYVGREFEPGNYSETINLSNLTSGFYFYKYEAGNYKKTEKLLIKF